MTNRFNMPPRPPFRDPLHLYEFKEAFCLMLYQGQETKRVHDVWNSRDGITPFSTRIDGEECIHIAFNFDRCVPRHQLRPGDYFFRDVRPEEVQRWAAQSVDHHSPELDGAERAAKIEEVAHHLGSQWGGRGPYLDRAPFISAGDATT